MRSHPTQSSTEEFELNISFETINLTWSWGKNEILDLIRWIGLWIWEVEQKKLLGLLGPNKVISNSISIPTEFAYVKMPVDPCLNFDLSK